MENLMYWFNGILGNIVGTLYIGGYLGLKDSVFLSLPLVLISMGVCILT